MVLIWKHFFGEKGDGFVFVVLEVSGMRKMIGFLLFVDFTMKIVSVRVIPTKQSLDHATCLEETCQLFADEMP